MADQSRRDQTEVGALWAKRGPNGGLYFSGKIDGVGSVVVFENKRKRSEKSPDWRILRSDFQSDRQETEQ